MSYISSSTKQSDPHSLNGFYTTKEGLEMPFSTVTSPGVGVIIFLDGQSHSSEFANISGYGNRLFVTEKSFEKFKSNVLDKNVAWNDLVQIIGVPDGIPGKWRSNKDITKSNEGGKSKRNRRSTRRKPTKRRRNRRRNRKTKKN